MKNKLFIATVVVLSGSLLQAAHQTGKEDVMSHVAANVAAHVQQQPAAIPLQDVTRETLNLMNRRQQRPTAASSAASHPDPNSTAAVFEREVLVLGIR